MAQKKSFKNGEKKLIRLNDILFSRKGEKAK
jgi:hypothetical protein